MEKETPIYRKPNDYHNLIAYRKADLVYVLNYWFISNSPLPCRRTFEQMEQAARSGKQNIVEGMNNYATSTASGLHLVNVARGSLLELQSDYEDFLKTNNFERWSFKDERFKAAQALGKSKMENHQYFLDLFSTRPPETNANLLLIFISQTIILIDGLIRKLETDFKEKGGFRENMYRYRNNKRSDNSK